MACTRLALLLLLPFTLTRTAGADVAPIPEDTTINLTLAVAATCPEPGQTGAIPLKPPCTFDGWTAQVQGLKLPAGHATGARWLPRCDVDDQGECPFAVRAIGEIHGDQFDVQSYTVAPVGLVTATGKVLAPRDVMCTEQECAQDDPCCNKCGHGGWKLANERPDVPVYTAADVPDLPQCELDGCGGCSYRLTAWGVDVGGIFIASSHEPTDLLPLSAMGKCTLIACVGANPCCNTCGFMGWSVGTRKAIPGDGVEALPPCELDGCGQCPWQLLVSGEERGDTFVVTRWERYPAAPTE